MNAPTRRPLPDPTPLSIEFWQAARSGQLLYARCGACGNAQFPLEVACIHCLSPDVRWVAGAGRGTLYSYTVIHRAPFADFPVPSVMAIVQLDEGYSMFAGVVDCAFDTLACDMPVEVTFEIQSETVTLPMFRPAER
ncbi:Zn-ribbon domain-containing OB-fold protein [Jatrophihabitans sp. DSM 45814]